MDTRANLIRLAMNRLKRRKFEPRRVRLPGEHRKPLMPEERLIRKRLRNKESVKALYAKRRANNHCQRCDTPAVVVRYYYQNKLVIERVTMMCPKHWEGSNLRGIMQDVIQSNYANVVIKRGNETVGSNGK